MSELRVLAKRILALSLDRQSINCGVLGPPGPGLIPPLFGEWEGGGGKSAETFLRQVSHTDSIIGNTTLIVGIDGLGGAGKSTLAEQLVRLLQESGKSVFLLHIDDFIHPRAVRYNDAVPEWACYYYLQWRYEALRAVLAPLKREGTFSGEVQLYDKENDTYVSQNLSITQRSIVIAEGVFLQRRELAELFDCMIYLDVPEEIRLRRVLQRDGYIGDAAAVREKYERRYFPAERYYVRTCRPAERADYVMQRRD